MNVAKYLLLVVLALPVLELIVFVTSRRPSAFCGP